MYSLYKAFGSVRSSLLCFNSPERSAEKLDPLVRDALAAAIEQDTTGCRTECDQLEEELSQSNKALRDSIEKEQFIYMRYKQYEKILEHKSREIEKEKKTVDVESTADLNRREAQLESEKTALEGVKKAHKDMVASCEQMRRKVQALERKKAKVDNLGEECQSFVDRARAATPDEITQDYSVEPAA